MKTVAKHIAVAPTFYSAIRKAVVDNADAVRAAVKTGGKSNQVGDNLGFSTIPGCHQYIGGSRRRL